jgi:hypothetical protein
MSENLPRFCLAPVFFADRPALMENRQRMTRVHKYPRPHSGLYHLDMRVHDVQALA